MSAGVEGLGTTPPSHPDEDAVKRFLDAVRASDRAAAHRVLDERLRGGMDPVDIVCDLLAPAQARVGRHWEAGRWSVALEHRASAVTAAALEALTPGPFEPSEGRGVTTPVVCCEGEWHTLPAQMASAVMRMRDIPAEMIGPSLPADEIAGFLGPVPPPVVAVSCSLPTHLIGAWRTIRALRACGVIVVAGGRGFGPDGRWGRAIGAHHVAGDFREGASLVASLRRGVSGLPLDDAVPGGAAAEVEILRVEAPAWTETVTTTARRRWHELDRHPEAVVATRADVRATLQAIGSAVLVADESLVVDFVGWLESVIAARGLPLSFVSAAFALLSNCIPERHGRLRAMAAVGYGASTQPLS